MEADCQQTGNQEPARSGGQPRHGVPEAGQGAEHGAVGEKLPDKAYQERCKIKAQDIAEECDKQGDTVLPVKEEFGLGGHKTAHCQQGQINAHGLHLLRKRGNTDLGNGDIHQGGDQTVYYNTKPVDQPAGHKG